MKIKRELTYKCTLCKQVVVLREYEGIPGGLYGNHYCEHMTTFLLNAVNKAPIDALERVA